MQLPMDSRVVNGVYAENTDKLWISGQTQVKSAVLYEVDSNTLKLSTHTADTIYSYASLLGNGKGAVEVAGFSNPHSTDLEGDFANLWMTTVSSDSSVKNEMLEEVSSYPVDMRRVDKTGTTFLLTETQMFTRVCR